MMLFYIIDGLKPADDRKSVWNFKFMQKEHPIFWQQRAESRVLSFFGGLKRIFHGRLFGKAAENDFPAWKIRALWLEPQMILYPGKVICKVFSVWPFYMNMMPHFLSFYHGMIRQNNQGTTIPETEYFPVLFVSSLVIRQYCCVLRLSKRKNLLVWGRRFSANNIF